MEILRPKGVTLLSIILALGSIIEIAFGVLVWFVFNNSPKLQEVEKSMSIYISITCIAFGIIGLAIAYGLWSLEDWARIATIVLCVFIIIGSIGDLYLLNIMQKVGKINIIVTEYVFISVAIASVITIWYLIRVKDIFV